MTSNYIQLPALKTTFSCPGHPQLGDYAFWLQNLAQNVAVSTSHGEAKKNFFDPSQMHLGTVST